MKTAIICTYLLLSSCCLFGQEIHEGIYRFNQSRLKEFSPQIDTLSKESEEMRSGHKINVIRFSKDKSIVYYNYIPFSEKVKTYTRKFLIFKTNRGTKDSKYAPIYNGRVYQMSADDFFYYTDPIYSRFKGVEVGVYTVPFRLRDLGGKYFDFESSLSLQSNLIFGFGRKTKPNSWIDFSIGLGLTGVTIDSLNSDLPASVGSRSASALTWSAGFVLKPNRFANVGVFMGMDHLGLKDTSTNWVYDGKFWLGLGINISFNQVNTDKSAKLKNNKQADNSGL